MATGIRIVGTGARTPLGLKAPESAVALRAGISGLGRHPFFVDRFGDSMPAALDGALDARLLGCHRLLRLAESALREACSPLERVAEQRLRMPIYLGLPELRPGFGEEDAEFVRVNVARTAGLPIEISEVRASTKGHASGLAAMAVAAKQIREGVLEACLVGGADSYFHPDTMEWLDANRQLTGAGSRSAFVPGEGAAFCLLVSDGLCRRLGVGETVAVVSASMSKESSLIKSSDVCLGLGLTEAVREALRPLRPPVDVVTDIYCDVNGERYRSEEWGFVCLRLAPLFRDPTAYVSPADSWGDMGAASGPLFAMLTFEGARRNHNNGERTLLWASSEGKLRGAVLLATAPRQHSGELDA
jgi:3-oxoacyl-[acyl-carrier-protein] synthase-1